jgi:hypothetical protein
LGGIGYTNVRPPFRIIGYIYTERTKKVECREAGTKNQTNERRNKKAVDVSDSGTVAIAEYKKQMERLQSVWRKY